MYELICSSVCICEQPQVEQQHSSGIHGGPPATCFVYSGAGRGGGCDVAKTWTCHRAPSSLIRVCREGSEKGINGDEGKRKEKG